MVDDCEIVGHDYGVRQQIRTLRAFDLEPDDHSAGVSSSAMACHGRGMQPEMFAKASSAPITVGV